LFLFDFSTVSREAEHPLEVGNAMNALKVTLAALALPFLLVACGGGNTASGDPGVFSQAHPVATNAGPLAAMAMPRPRQAVTVRTPDASSFLNWAESAYPSYFPGAQANKTLDVWTYRYYPQTDIYLGTNTSGDVLGLRGQGGGAYESIPLGKIADYGCSVYPSDCAAAAKCTPPLVPLGNICADPAAVAELAALDSLLRPVPESFWTSASIGGGGSGDGGGGDGSAGDGAPIANAPVVLTDNAGHTATTTTDAQGYYRINLTGFTPPFIVKVTRPDGTAWYSGSTTAPTKRGFITINLTGLTDKIASDVAVAGGKTASSQLTPDLLASEPLTQAKQALNEQISSNLIAVGLEPKVFDAITKPFVPDHTGYDAVLDSLKFCKIPNGSTSINGAGGFALNFTGAIDSMTGGSGNECFIMSYYNDFDNDFDLATGGGGADAYVFAAPVNSFGAAWLKITDFDTVRNGDKIDLRPFLVGQNSMNVSNYIHYERRGSDTLMHISRLGGFAGDGHLVSDLYSSGARNLTIQLSGADFTAGFPNDLLAIQNMIANLKLAVNP
jgi:hypothetical protein